MQPAQPLEYLELLFSTPFPVIFVFFGLVVIVFGLGTRIPIKDKTIGVPPGNRKIALIIGFFFVILGLLYPLIQQVIDGGNGPKPTSIPAVTLTPYPSPTHSPTPLPPEEMIKNVVTNYYAEINKGNYLSAWNEYLSPVWPQKLNDEYDNYEKNYTERIKTVEVLEFTNPFATKYRGQVTVKLKNYKYDGSTPVQTLNFCFEYDAGLDKWFILSVKNEGEDCNL